MTDDRKRSKATTVLMWTVGSLVLFVGAVLGGYALDTRGEPRSLRGVEIDGRPAGDLTTGELAMVVDDLAAEVAAGIVRISLPDGPREMRADEIGVSLDSERVEQEAMAVGRDGGSFDRFWAWLASFTGRYSVGYGYVFDPEEAAGTVAGFDELLVQEPVEPRLVLDGDQSLTVRPGTDGVRVDQEAIVDRLADQVEAGGPFVVDAPTVAVPPGIDEAALAVLAEQLNVITASGVVVGFGEEERTLTAAALRVRLDVTGVDGTASPTFDLGSLQRLLEEEFAGIVVGGRDPGFEIEDDVPVVVEEGAAPRECCDEASSQVVAEAVFAESPGPVALEPKPPENPLEVAWASGEEVVEMVAEFTTDHSCCESRVSNIQRFADIVRGVYLIPGESLSLNEHVGERTSDRGFVPAGTIIRGHLVPTVGGGVSQFATTMFNAAFFAGFDFVAYQSHSIYFSRYPYGREATISWPLPDLEFTNTTEYPALIWTSYTDTSITVSIYSTKSVDVEQTDQEVSNVRECTRVDTYRQRTYDDGRSVEDSVFAVYRPDEGLDCNGDPTEPPDL